MRFKEIPGLEEEKKNLIEMVRKDRVAHAHLFFSELGGAAFPMAMAFSTYLNCEDPEPDDSCGRCPACLKNDKNIHPDVHFSFPVTSTPDHSKTDELTCDLFLPAWREYIQYTRFPAYSSWMETFRDHFQIKGEKNFMIYTREGRELVHLQSLAPFEGKFKIFLVWLSELFHSSASNSLLKALEEPSPKTIFILVSHDLEGHLPTIISRTQKHIIPRLPLHSLSQYLSEIHGLEPDMAKKAALLAEGNVPEALHLAGMKNRVDFSEVQKWLQLCWVNGVDELGKEAEKFNAGTKDAQKSFFFVGLKALQNTLHAGKQIHADVWPEELALFFHKLQKTLNPEKMEKIRQELEDAIRMVDRNLNARILFFAKSQRLHQIMQA